VVPVPFPLLFPVSALIYSRNRMQDYTATLRVGARAPDFKLRAANRQEEFLLSGLLASGTLILEFLRGTW
jgi:hypothetical protein